MPRSSVRVRVRLVVKSSRVEWKEGTFFVKILVKLYYLFVAVIIQKVRREGKERKA